MSLPDHVDNIMTYVEREDMQGRPFIKFQQFDLFIGIMTTCYKNSFIGKAKYCFKIEHDKINNIPFELYLQNLGTTCEIWENDLHIDTPKHTSKGVHSVQYDDEEYEYCPLHSITSEEKCQVLVNKGHTVTIYDKFFNNMIVGEIYRKHPELER